MTKDLGHAFYTFISLKVPYVACVACGIDKYYSLSQHGYSYYTQHPVLPLCTYILRFTHINIQQNSTSFQNQTYTAQLIKIDTFSYAFI